MLEAKQPWIGKGVWRSIVQLLERIDAELVYVEADLVEVWGDDEA